MDCELYLNKAIFKNQQFNMLVYNLTRTRKKFNAASRYRLEGVLITGEKTDGGALVTTEIGIWRGRKESTCTGSLLGEQTYEGMC